MHFYNGTDNFQVDMMCGRNVDEYGTEAAAATYAIAVAECFKRQLEKVTFIADHPSFYIFHHGPTECYPVCRKIFLDD